MLKLIYIIFSAKPKIKFFKVKAHAWFQISIDSVIYRQYHINFWGTRYIIDRIIGRYRSRDWWYSWYWWPMLTILILETLSRYHTGIEILNHERMHQLGTKLTVENKMLLRYMVLGTQILVPTIWLWSKHLNYSWTPSFY